MSETRNHTTRDQLAEVLYSVLVDHHVWIGDDGQPLDYSPEREARLGDLIHDLADALLASDAIAAVRAAAVAETTATIEALAAKWERQEYKPGSFHPEAIAYADGRDTQAEACADEIREVLSGGRTALDTALAQARAELREQIARGIEDSRDRNQGNPAALAYLTHAAAIARHGRVEGADQ